MGHAKKKDLAAVLRFDRSFGADELNLAEFPLAALTHRVDPNQRTLTFEDDIFDEGAQQQVHRKLVVSASDHLGLPTPLDSDVLLVILYATNAQNGLTERQVYFTRYELLKLLNWNEGGKSYKRLDESLNRWASVTLYYNQAWWERSARRWRSRTFHVIESLDLRGRSGTGDDSRSSFTWNEALFGSFQSRNIKRLNLELYFRLQNVAARQAYRFLDKRFYRSKSLEFDLRVFACEHIGFARSYDSAQLKRRLQPAIEELEEAGILAKLPISERYRKRGRGDWAISLVMASRTQPRVIADATSPLATKLVEKGLTLSQSRELVRDHRSDLIEERIALHDWLLSRNDRRINQNPPGFLVDSIRKQYPLPKDFQRAVARQAPRPAPIPKPAPSPERSVEREACPFKEAWDTLEDSKQQEYEALALSEATSFHKATYERLRVDRGPLFEAVRREILVAWFRSRGLLAVETKASLNGGGTSDPAT